MEIIQVVGYKNSGKTTIASKIINILSSNNRVASLKHHGHGGIPLGFKQTDSEKHKQAGALVAGVEGESVLQLSMDEWDIDQMIVIYELMDIEILVIEGYKYTSFPKVVLINKEEDLALLESVDHIRAVVTSVPLEKESGSYIIFNSDELDEFYEWIVTFGGKKSVFS